VPGRAERGDQQPTVGLDGHVHRGERRAGVRGQHAGQGGQSDQVVADPLPGQQPSRLVHHRHLDQWSYAIRDRLMGALMRQLCQMAPLRSPSEGQGKLDR
jgi:hypothetical protein